MSSHVDGWGKRIGRIAWLSGAVFAFMAANEDNGCQPDVPEGGTEAECRVASDCQGDPGIDCVGAWACNTGTCQFECGERPPPETGCYGDDDCTGGLVCNAADVCNAPPGCDAGETCAAVCYGECVRPLQPTGCTHSGQCRAGEFCTTEIGECNSPCADGMACPAVCYGECKPRENGAICYDDAECRTGQVCDRDPCVFPESDSSSGAADRIACGGVCADSETCSSNEDCGRGEVCGCGPFQGDAPPNGLIPCYLQCIPSEPVCASDADCVAGQVCQSGICTETQRECRDDSQCPMGFACEPQCNSAGGAGEPSGDFAAPYCPSMCVPRGGTCADDGTVCAPGETCVNECVTICADADCACEEGTDCRGCGCWEECRSACVPEYGGCDPNQCPEGTHCGCADYPYAPANGLIFCEEKCIDDEPQHDCWSDYDCREGQYCAPSDCATPAPCDPASDEACANRPAPACPGTCEPKTDYECSSDRECVSADGRQGTCAFEVCETFAVPCSSDDASCMPQSCYGFCRYEGANTCDPNDPAACPRGSHCEATSGCGGASDGGAEFRPCLIQYECVRDQVVECRTDCDCSADTACVEGQCSVTDRLNECYSAGDCTSDDQCREGSYCKIDYTAPVCDCVNCPCSIPHGTCTPRDDIERCESDDDCGASQYCGCGQDPSCPMCDVCLFQCMPSARTDCKQDSDCRDTQHCEFYYPPCAPPPDDPSFAPPPQCEPIGICEEGPPRRE